MDLDPALDDLDAAATLAAVEGELLTRRAAEARDLALAAHWADLHASDPRRRPVSEWSGEDRLVEVGGDGTPWVQELSISEFSVARRVHYFSGRRAIADALDLRHRLPRWWTAVQNLRIEPWIARKAATYSRVLDEHAVRLVDEALPDDLGELSPHRLLEVVKAKVIEADPARHAALLEAEKRKRYVSLGRVDEFGLQHVLARIRAGEVALVNAMVDQVADLLAPRFPDGTTRDELRSEAFVWLAQPAQLLALLQGDSDDVAKARPRAVLYVHLSEEAIRGDGVARVEDVGPVLAREIPEWLGHHHVTVRPVIDLEDHTAFDAYEVAGSLAERVHLRSPADTFPHANQVTRRLDHDHVEPFVPGVPGQTGDHNLQPLGRTGHRAKTHAGFRVRQLGPGTYVWRTPHHLYRLVDSRGTTVLPVSVGAALFEPADHVLAG